LFYSETKYKRTQKLNSVCPCVDFCCCCCIVLEMILIFQELKLTKNKIIILIKNQQPPEPVVYSLSLLFFLNLVVSNTHFIIRFGRSELLQFFSRTKSDKEHFSIKWRPFTQYYVNTKLKYSLFFIYFLFKR
jgi:hypothetical protein